MKKFLLPFFILIFVFEFFTFPKDSYAVSDRRQCRLDAWDMFKEGNVNFGGWRALDRSCRSLVPVDDGGGEAGITSGTLTNFVMGFVERFNSAPATRATKENQRTAPLQEVAVPVGRQATPTREVATSLDIKWQAPSAGAEYYRLSVYGYNGRQIVRDEKVSGLNYSIRPELLMANDKELKVEVYAVNMSKRVPSKELRSTTPLVQNITVPAQVSELLPSAPGTVRLGVPKLESSQVGPIDSRR